MNVILKELRIENFKGIKSFGVEFKDDRTVIKGCNGSGKTSVYDASLWLLFGKDSDGRTDFGIHPLLKTGQVDAGVVTHVEAFMLIDGEAVTLRKDLEENNVKGQVRGYSTSTWINDVPKKISDYRTYIAGLIPEDTFKMLTDTHCLNGKLDWPQRREVLLSICGEIGDPEGFDELLGLIGNRTADEYKDILREQKKLKTNERDEINPRIDEIKKAVPEQGNTDSSTLRAKREALQTQITEIEDHRNDILKSNESRHKKIDEITKLRAEQAKIQSDIINDTSHIQKYIDERNELSQKAMEYTERSVVFKNKIQRWKLEVASKKADAAIEKKELDHTRNDYRAILEMPEIQKCPRCNQELPPDMAAEMNANRTKDLAALRDKGTALKKTVTDLQAEIDSMESDIAAFEKDVVEPFQVKQDEFNAYRMDREKQIDIAVRGGGSRDYKEDPKWSYLNEKIEKMESEVLESRSQELAAAEEMLKDLRSQIEAVNKALSQEDRTEQDKARIAKLEEREQELSNDIADIDRRIAMIGDYKARQSELIEESVNDRFEHVKFKLFDVKLNESIVECCTATFQGVPYRDMSYGQKILCGVDCINTLSDHFDIHVPLFIDNAESITYDLKTEMQTVELRALKSAYNLKVE